MVDLRKSLDIILEEEQPIDGWHPLDSAMDLARQLQSARQQVADLEHQLSTIKVRMAGDLALSIRRTMPGLNVAVDKNGCKVGYKTKYLHFMPEVEQEIWRVISPNRRFLREFQQANRRALLLDSNLSVLVTAIAAYFANYYRTLHEDIIGTGVLMVEEKLASLLELARWRNNIIKNESHRPLNTRLTRLNGREVVKSW